MTRAAQLRSAAHAHDHACDCCGHDPATEYADDLREALRANPSFIGEAFGGDLTELVAAFLSKDLQHTHDAISDLIDAHLKSEEVRATASRFGEGLVTGLERLCRLHEVAA